MNIRIVNLGMSQGLKSVAAELVNKWAAIVEVDSTKPTAPAGTEQSASGRPGASSQKSDANGKAAPVKTAPPGKKPHSQPADKRAPSVTTASKPAGSAFGGGFGSMFGKPGASRTGRPTEHAPSTMRMNPLPRPEVDDHDDDGGDRGTRPGIPSPRTIPPQPPLPPARLAPLALPDSKRSALPPPTAKTEAPAISKAAPPVPGNAAAAGTKRPFDSLRLPVPQAPAPAGAGGMPSTVPGTGKEEDRPGGTKRRRRGNGPLSVSWASQLTDVREYVPNPEEWGKNPRHLHGDEFSDAVGTSRCFPTERGFCTLPRCHETARSHERHFSSFRAYRID